MTPTEAAKLLEISPEATPEQLEARFLELRTKLEDKIVKAPTPGLKAKYRESLEKITEAFESLTLAADSSSLPILNKGEAASAAPTPPPPATPSPEPTASSPAPKPRKKKSGNMEIVLVAIVAILLLGGGGWWLMKVRSENAEKARIEAEQLRLAEEEQARLAALAVKVRTQLAEYKIIWEVAEREESDAERRVSELRTELRNLRNPLPEQRTTLIRQIKIAQRYYDWLRNLLLQHPTKLASAKVEQLLEAKVYDDLEPTGAELQQAVQKLQEVLEHNRNGKGTLEIQTNLPTLSWSLRDDLNRVIQQGTGPTLIKGLEYARHYLSYSAPNLGQGGRKPLDINPGTRYPVKLEFDYNRVSVEDLPLEARLQIDGQPVTLLPDGTVAVKQRSILSAYRAGYLPMAKNVDTKTEVAAFEWIPLNTPDLANFYLERIAPYSPYQRALHLKQLQLSLRGSNVIDQNRWVELYSKVLEDNDQEPHLVGRIKTLLGVAKSTTIVDRAFTIKVLNQAADLISSASNEDIKKLNRTSLLFQIPAWRWAPEAGKKFSAAQERAGNLSNAFYGYIRAGAYGDADRVEQALWQKLPANNREWRQNSHNSHRKKTEFTLNYVLPLEAALARRDRSAYSKIIATGIPESKEGGSVYTISTMLWHYGLQSQAMELHHETNSSYAPVWLIEGLLMKDRVDLLETWVTSSRSRSRNYGSTNAKIGLQYALSGNKQKAKEMLAQPRGERDVKVTYTELSERALAYEIIGDREASKNALNSLEKHSDLKEKTWIGGISHAIYALHRQGDLKRANRLLEKIKKTPRDMSRWSTWSWTGQVKKATDALLARLNGASFKPAVYQSFYKQWMSLAEFKSQDVPVWADDNCIEGLILAQIDYSYRNGKFYSSNWPTPHAQQVAVTLKQRTGFYFPNDAVEPKGKASVEITVNDKGEPIAYKTISSDDPAFAAELIKRMPDWEFFPALKMGKPTEGTYTFTGNFTKK